MEVRDAHIAERRRDPNAYVLLSLYLLLLAFFIVLNVISKEELTRADAAIGSVTSTFRTDSAVNVDEIAASNTAGLFKSRAVFFSGVQKLFEQALPVAKFNLVHDGAVLRTSLAVSKVFRSEQPVFHSRSVPLLDGIANAISAGTPGIRYEMEVLIRTGPVLPQGPGAVRTLETRRAIAFAEALRKRGAPPPSIRVGVMPGDPGELQLSFYARVEDRAKVTFDALVRP